MKGSAGLVARSWAGSPEARRAFSAGARRNSRRGPPKKRATMKMGMGPRSATMRRVRSSSRWSPKLMEASRGFMGGRLGRTWREGG